MARRKKPSEVATRDTKIRLPEDIAQDIEKESRETGAPMNRVIINRLGMFDGLRQHGGKLGELLAHMEVLLARSSVRLGSIELSEQLLDAVDALLKAQGGALPAAIDKVRVARLVMLKSEGADKKLIEKLETK